MGSQRVRHDLMTKLLPPCVWSYSHPTTWEGDTMTGRPPPPPSPPKPYEMWEKLVIQEDGVVLPEMFKSYACHIEITGVVYHFQ